MLQGEILTPLLSPCTVCRQSQASVMAGAGQQREGVLQGGVLAPLLSSCMSPELVIVL